MPILVCCVAGIVAGMAMSSTLVVEGCLSYIR